MGSATSATRRVTEADHTTPVLPELHTGASTTSQPPSTPTRWEESQAQHEREQTPERPWYACCCPRWRQTGTRIVLMPMTPAMPGERILQPRGGGGATAAATPVPVSRPRAASLSVAASDEGECHARQNSFSAQRLSLSQLITPSNAKPRGARTRIVKARTPSGDFTLGAHKAVHLLSSLFAAALSESELAFLSSLAELHQYDRGQSIVTQGTHPSNELFVLCSGEVCVEVEGPDGISEEAFEGTTKPTPFHSAAPPNAVKPASNRSRAASRTGSWIWDKTIAPCDPAHPIISPRESAVAMVPLGTLSCRRQSLPTPIVAPTAVPTADASATDSSKLLAPTSSLLSERRRSLSVLTVGSHGVTAPTSSPPPASDSSLLSHKDKALISPTGAFVLRGQRQAPSPKTTIDPSLAASPAAAAAPMYRRLALQSSGFVFGLESVWKLEPPALATQAAVAVSTPTLAVDVSTPRPMHLLPRSHTSSRKVLGQEMNSADTSAETTPRATPRGSLSVDSPAPSPSEQQQQPPLADLPPSASAPPSSSPVVLPSFPRVSNVVALTDCTCLRLSQLALTQFLRRFPQTFDPLLSVLGQHIESSMDSVSFLRVLSHPKRRLFGSLFAAKLVERNTVLFEEGQKCDDDSCMYFLHSGTVRIVLPSAGCRAGASTTTGVVAPSRLITPTAPVAMNPSESLSGGPPKLLHPPSSSSSPQWHEKDLVAGTFFGELSLLLDVDRTATAISSTSCVLLTINRASLRNFMELAPEMLHEFRRNLGGYVQNSYLLLLPHFQTSFEEFCAREYSTENLAFWKECARFKSLAEAISAVQAPDGTASGECAGPTPGLVLTMAHALYAEFVADDAPRQVNLRAAHRSVIRLALENGSGSISSDLFMAASREIFALMSSDSFPRFRESELFAAALVRLNQPQPSTLLRSFGMDQETKDSSPMQPDSAERGAAPQNHRASSDGHRRSPFAALRALSSRLAPSSTAAAALTPSGASTPPLSPHSPHSRLRSAGALGMLNSGVGEPVAVIAPRDAPDDSMDFKDLPIAALHAADMPQAYLQMVQQRQQLAQTHILPQTRSTQQPLSLPQSTHRNSARSLPSSRRPSLGDVSVPSSPPLCLPLASSRPPPLHPPTPPGSGSSLRSIHLPLSPSTPIAARSSLRAYRSSMLSSDLDRESKPHPTILTSPSAIHSRSIPQAATLPSPTQTSELPLPAARADGSPADPNTPQLPAT